MKPTLLILAAGMASRYGSMKQIDHFGPNGETIIDYSIYDAIKAGFGKIVFIIKEEYAESFKSIFERKLNGLVETDYVYQSLDLKPFEIDRHIERTKPWGTGHALLSACSQVDRPFCIINADDFYGLDAFKKMEGFLTSTVSDKQFSLMGYEVENTLSEHGSVSRGICTVDENDQMTAIKERTQVFFKNNDTVVFEEDGIISELPHKTRVSMNFWGFTPAVFDRAKSMFADFVEDNYQNPKSEFFIPLIADNLIKSGDVSFLVLPTSAKWFGVTYKEDKAIAQKEIAELIKHGVYPEKLWNN